MGDSGRDEEFEAFVAGQYQRMQRTAWLLCLDQHQAQDLLQGVLERTYLRWAHIRTNPTAYVQRSLSNATIDRFRRHGRQEVLTSRPPDTVRVDDFAPRLAQRDGLTTALERLTRRERAVVILRFLEDMSERDTAAVLGVRPGTVKSATARALAKLRVAPELQPTDPRFEEMTP